MERLGNPQDGLSCIHVAGTNGKGSVTAYLAAMLASDGYRVGVYTSPYLERFSERIRVLDGKESLERYMKDDAEGEIPEEDLFALSGRVEEAVRGMLADGEEHPTEFELVTAAAFLYFRRSGCDYVVLETGLGGRLDSTNVIRNPIFCVITALGFDHTDRLGSTMREIAAEKAGIIKSCRPVFLYSPYDTDLSLHDAEDAEEVISSVCREKGAPLTIVSSADIRVISSSAEGQTFEIPFFPDALSIRLTGVYQLENAALAVRAAIGLATPAGISDGLSRTVWKGRMEIIRDDPLILLDGGHNPQGALSFRTSVDTLFPERFREKPPRLIIGFMRDKDYPRILSILFKDLTYRFREIICVTPENPRALPAEELKNYIEEHFPAHALFYKNPASMYNRQDKISACDDACEACRRAASDSDADGSPILCMGSLYLAGQVRGTLIEQARGR